MLFSLLHRTDSYIIGISTLSIILSLDNDFLMAPCIPLSIACLSVSEHIELFLTFFNNMGYCCSDLVDLSPCTYPSKIVLHSNLSQNTILLSHEDETPLFKVAYLQYTAFMNAISPRRLIFFNPKLTFKQISIGASGAATVLSEIKLCYDPLDIRDMNLLHDLGFQVKSK